MARRKLHRDGKPSVGIEDTDNFINTGMMDHRPLCRCERCQGLRIAIRQRPHEACFDGDYDGRNQ